MTLITPSLLAADFAHMQAEVDSIAPFADWLQVDVMDGHFVPNLSFGAPVVRCLKTTLPLDIHLMVTNPADRIAEFAALKPKNITFHAEAVAKTNDRTALIKAIRSSGATAGIALSPDTELSAVDDVFGDIDVLLIMSVHPGFGGQVFIGKVLDKVRSARSKRPDLMIQMDGGIDAKTAKESVKAGANNLVAGSFIFKATDRKAAIESLRAA